MEEQVQHITETSAGVLGVTQLLTLHLGPDFIILAMKVAFKKGSTVEEVEDITDEIEKSIRSKVPEMKKIFIEPDSDGDLYGVIARKPASAA
jgi:divalent metal cation (Fe/Co/Zn/Cd) transporter